MQLLQQTAITLPFSIDSYGNVASTTTPSKIWADRVRSVIGTALQERVMRPQFGCQAALMIFETEELVRDSIYQDVSTAFVTWLPSLSLQDVTTAFDEQSNIISVEILYELPSRKLEAITLGIATLSGLDPISEDFIWQPL